MSRVPVCASCLSVPAPFSAEFFCSACRTPFLTNHPLDEAGLCGLCRRGWSAADAVYSFGEYAGHLQKLIHLLKYDGIETLADPLGRKLAQALPRDERFDVIVPVPLHWRKRWARGFNQAEVLARHVAKRRAVPIEKVLQRRKATVTQTGLTGPQRRRNMAAAFAVLDKAKIQGRRVLLVDDVYTTGATSQACARVLRSAGAARVTLLTLARVNRRGGGDSVHWAPGGERNEDDGNSSD